MKPHKKNKSNWLFLVFFLLKLADCMYGTILWCQVSDLQCSSFQKVAFFSNTIAHPINECFHLFRLQIMRGSRGGVQTLPWNLQSLISPILLEMKKLVIFHICALPRLYVKDGPPWKNFLDPRLQISPVLNTCSMRGQEIWRSHTIGNISSMNTAIYILSYQLWYNKNHLIWHHVTSNCDNNIIQHYMH